MDPTVQREIINFFTEIHSIGYTVKTSPLRIRSIPGKRGKSSSLYKKEKYLQITEQMKTWQKIGLGLLVLLLFLAICYAMKKDSALREKITSSDQYKKWVKIVKKIEAPKRTDDVEDDKVEDSDVEDDKVSNTPVCSYTGLRYTGNSCYQDSVLLALLARPIKFIRRNILTRDVKNISSSSNREIKCGQNFATDYTKRKSIQDELVSVTDTIRRGKGGDYTCSNLRNLIKSCPGSQQFHTRETQDAGEFLQYIFTLFDVKGMKKTITVKITNDLSPIPKSTRLRVTKQDTIDTVPIVSVIPGEETDLTLASLLRQTDDSFIQGYKGPDGKEYRRRIEITDITDAEFLVFSIQRTFLNNRGVEQRSFVRILPSEKIMGLELYAIVVHRNVHYTCYIKCDQGWFYYDDTKDTIKYIGNYTDMLKNNPSPVREGTLYFYS